MSHLEGGPNAIGRQVEVVETPIAIAGEVLNRDTGKPNFDEAPRHSGNVSWIVAKHVLRIEK